MTHIPITLLREHPGIEECIKFLIARKRMLYGREEAKSVHRSETNADYSLRANHAPLDDLRAMPFGSHGHLADKYGIL